MKSFMNYSKLVFASLIASGAFVSCSDEISENSVDTPYAVNTSYLKSAGQAVDLGLTSKTKWADRNVGASSATDNGVLFIWGDVTGTQSLATIKTYEACAVTDAALFKKYVGAKQVAYLNDSIQVYNDNYIELNNAPVEDVYNGAVAIMKSLRSKYADRLEATIEATATDGTSLFILADLVDNELTVLDSNNYRDDTTRVAKQEVEYPKAVEALATAEKTLNEKKTLLEKVKQETPNDASAIERKQNAVDKAQAAYQTAKDKVAYWETYVNDQKLFFNSYGVVVREIKSSGEDTFYTAKDVADSDYKTSKRTYSEKEYAKEYVGHDYANIASNDLIGNAQYDAATANWGADWQMPTNDQLKELIDECEWTFTGNGYTVTGPNGNTIFLPADGYRYGNSQIAKGTAGYYVSGSILGTYHFPSQTEQKNGGLGSISGVESMPNMLIFQHGDFDNGVKMYNNLTTIYGVSVRPVAK